MAFCGSRREDTPLLKADSTAALLDDYQSGADSDYDYDYDTGLSRERNGDALLNYSNLRGFALAVAFISWILMAVPLMFWLLLPFVLIRRSDWPFVILLLFADTFTVAGYCLPLVEIVKLIRNRKYATRLRVAAWCTFTTVAATLCFVVSTIILERSSISLY